MKDFQIDENQFKINCGVPKTASIDVALDPSWPRLRIVSPTGLTLAQTLR